MRDKLRKFYYRKLDNYRDRMFYGKEFPFERSVIWNSIYNLRRNEEEYEEGVVKTNIEQLKDLYSGKRCFIVGSAPSIKSLDLEKIHKEYIILLNNAYLLKEEFGKHPEGWILGDPAAYEDYAKTYDYECFKDVFLSMNIPAGWTSERIHRYSYYKFPNIYDGFCEFDLSKPIYQAHTVALSACQIAIGMGFKEIVLIGIDLNFSKDKLHFYESKLGENVRFESITSDRISHMRRGFLVLEKFAKDMGVKLINASPIDGIGLENTVNFEELFV